jgi:hypothetical protein
VNENNGERMANFEDINGDGSLDLVVQIVDDMTLARLNQNYGLKDYGS